MSPEDETWAQAECRRFATDRGIILDPVGHWLMSSAVTAGRLVVLLESLGQPTSFWPEVPNGERVAVCSYRDPTWFAVRESGEWSEVRVEPGLEP
jgi:hypothetical protein